MIVEVSLTSSFPIIWILLKWAFEVANYWTGSKLGSFESTFCAGCLVGVPRGADTIGERWCGVGGGGVWGWQWTAGVQYVRGPMSTISGIRRERGRRGGGSCVRQLWELQCVETVTATLHNLTSHNHAHQSHWHSLFLFFSQSYTKYCLRKKLRGFKAFRTFRTFRTNGLHLACQCLEQTPLHIQNNNSLNTHII